MEVGVLQGLCSRFCLIHPHPIQTARYSHSGSSTLFTYVMSRCPRSRFHYVLHCFVGADPVRDFCKIVPWEVSFWRPLFLYKMVLALP